MSRENLNDLIAFLAVARDKSFTRAAAKLFVFQSVLNHTIRVLDERLGLRQQSLTTLSVNPTTVSDPPLLILRPNEAQI